MKEILQKRCELFVENRDRIKETFIWENSYMYPLCACLFAQKDRDVQVEKLVECKKLLKDMTTLFSNFRGNSMMATVTLLALEENPEDKLEKMLSVYELLKGEFFASEYLTVAASAIVDMTTRNQYAQIVKRTRDIYDLMKSKHPIITSGEDSTFAALLALSDLSEQRMAEEMERCYGILKPNFMSSNAVQSLSHVLALGEGSAEVKCRRVLALYECLKKKGYKYGTTYELATIGPLALMDVEIEILAQEIIQVDEYLKQQKGFGVFGIGSKQRMMYAGMLTMCDYAKDLSIQNTASVNGVVAMLIAQQAAICASVAAAAAASSSSS